MRKLIQLMALVLTFSVAGLPMAPEALAAPKKKKPAVQQKRKPASSRKTASKPPSSKSKPPAPKTSGRGQKRSSGGKKPVARKAEPPSRKNTKTATARPSTRASGSPTRSAASAQPPTGSYAPSFSGNTGLAGTDDSEKALKISGQSRNLNMMLILRGENERTEFGEIRKDYRQEVLATQY